MAMLNGIKRRSVVSTDRVVWYETEVYSGEMTAPSGVILGRTTPQWRDIGWIDWMVLALLYPMIRPPPVGAGLERLRAVVVGQEAVELLTLVLLSLVVVAQVKIESKT